MMMMRSSVLLTALLGLGVRAQESDPYYWPWQTFKTVPHMQPPSLNVTKYGETAPGYLFFQQNGLQGHNFSAFIMSDDNELVWQSAYGDLTSFRVQTFEGKPVLTLFNGITFPEPWGFGYGIVQIFDDTYKNIYNVTLENVGFRTIEPLMDPSYIMSWIDMHESHITPEGTILLTANNVTQWDLSPVGGPTDGWIVDSLFYEVDIKTNEILYSWSHLDHLDEIPLVDALDFYPLGDLGNNQSYPWGPFHINTVEKFADGSFLISSRFYSSCFHIGLDGGLVWKLEGYSGGDFKLGEGVQFSYQHDCRIHQERGDVAVISLFNNDNSGVVPAVNQSTAIILEVDAGARTANLIKDFYQPDQPVYAKAQGNAQLIYRTGWEDANVFVGYGSLPVMKEFGPDGSVLMSAEFGPAIGGVYSYRSFRMPWVGRPTTAPDVFACRDEAAAKTHVYMSWNGATEHRTWNVFAAAAANRCAGLRLAATVDRKGFETEAVLDGLFDSVRAEAVGEGIETGVSRVFTNLAQC